MTNARLLSCEAVTIPTRYPSGEAEQRERARFAY